MGWKAIFSWTEGEKNDKLITVKVKKKGSAKELL